MQTQGRFLVRLLIAAACIAMPLIALIGYSLFDQQRHARNAAHAQVTADATERSKDVDALLVRGEALLTLLATRPDVISLDPSRCREALRGLAAIDPLYADIAVTDVEGRIVCNTRNLAPGSRNFGEYPWFRDALHAPGLRLSPPFLTQRPRRLIALTLPVRGGDGSPIALVGVAMDLVELSERVLARGLPEGASMTLTRDGTVLTRAPDAARWIGHQTPSHLRSARREAPGAVLINAGPDGVVRAYANTEVGRHGLSVTAGLPTDVIFAGSREALWRSVVLASLSLVLALAAALYGARWLAAPLRSLSSTARAWAGGARDVRADESLPGEFRQLAVEFNRMIDARHASEERLRSSEQRYAAMLDGVDVIAITVDVQGRLAWCNDALLRLTGWTREEIIGEPWSPRFLPPEQEQIRAFLRERFGQGQAPRRHENEIVTRDGTRRLIRWSNATMHDDAGVVTGTACIGEDISERRSTELAQQASMAAEAANRAKTEFLSRMSHELRTPLNAVLGFAQLLQRTARPRLEPEEQRQLDLIATGGAQLRALIDDVMDVSRIESGQLAVRAEDVDLSTLLQGVLRLAEANAAPLGVRIESRFLERPPLTLRVDPLRLQQIMANLISNAIKYNGAGGSVAVDFTVDPGEVRISVSDTGIGMTPEQLAGLFQPFNRLGRERSGVEGTGIGMVLSRELVRLLGGDISVESATGRGTRVQVCLPHRRALPAPPTALVGTPAPPASSSASGFGSSPASSPASAPAASLDDDADPGGLVLYVEDNPLNAALVEGLLSSWPEVRVVIAPDGASGLVQADLQRPDVVLLDGQLPDMDGLQVLRLLRERPQLADVPIVVLSASAMPHEIENAMRAGVQDYWTKPISAAPFLAGMRRLLRAAALRRAEP